MNATTKTVQRNVDSFFQNSTLFTDFDAFIEAPENMRIVEKSYGDVTYIISRLVGRVPKSMHWDALNAYGQFKKYTIDQFKYDVKYALLNRWYISILHSNTVNERLLCKMDAEPNIRNLLAKRDPIITKDLKEVSYEVAKSILHIYMEKMLCNLVSPISPAD